jgi:small redox-active disulfide protein 2
MRRIEVLGSGCAKCKKLEELTRKAVEELLMVAEVVKVSDINRIVDYGVMMTPGLVVDGKVVLTGRLPGLEELKKLLQEAAK